MDNMRLDFDPHIEPWSARAGLNHKERIDLIRLIGACLLVDLGFVAVAASLLM